MMEDDNVCVVISSDQLNPILKALDMKKNCKKRINNCGGNIGLQLVKCLKKTLKM